MGKVYKRVVRKGLLNVVQRWVTATIFSIDLMSEDRCDQIILQVTKKVTKVSISCWVYWIVNLYCCQVVWRKWTNHILIVFQIVSIINSFRSWHTFIKNKLMHISLFFINVCQLLNKFMLMWNKNILIWFVHFCQTTWQQQMTMSPTLRQTYKKQPLEV